MNSTGSAPRTIKRLSSAAVVIGSAVAVLASPLALGTASAAPTAHTFTSVSIAGGSQNQGLQTGATATLTVNYTLDSAFVTANADTVPNIYLTFSGSGGPDFAQAPFPTGLLCAAPTPANTATSGTTTCSFTNNGTAGTDTVQVFGDNSNTTHKATDPGNVLSAGTNVTFSGAINSLSISPSNTSSSTGTCVVYTVTAKDAGGRLAGDRDVFITVTEPGTTSPTFIHYDGSCGTPVAGGTFTVHTGNDGTVKFGVSAAKAGSGIVQAANAASSPTAIAQSAATWNGVDNGGNNNVHALSVTPNSTSDYVWQTETFTVTATDAGGNPVQGAAISATTLSGPDAAPSCPTLTAPNGTTTCTVSNTGTPGTDNLQFWANYTGTPPAGCTTLSGSLDAGCEPSTLAGATFAAVPAAVSTITLTCPDQTNGGAPSTTCKVPVGQNDVTYTATVKDSGGNGVSGVVVTFTTTGTGTGANPPTTTPLTGTVTTGADGTAKFVVTNSTAANGDAVTVNAKVGNPAHGGVGPVGATATWQSRQASAIKLTPQVQTVTKGGAVSLVAQVVDQFGAGVATSNQLKYTVTGRNNLAPATVNTDATGSATITYQDSLSNSGTIDTIQVDDNTNPALNGQPSDFGTVKFIDGSTTASAVTIDTSGQGVSDVTCTPGAVGHPPAGSVTPPGPVALGAQTEVCAIVKNATGETLAGKSVTFTVSNGAVDSATSGTSATSTAVYTTTADANGVAFAKVTSTKSGAQTVTATADAASANSTVTYAAPTPAQARIVKIAPSPATIPPGSQQKFTATVTDSFGNGVQGVTVLFTQQGPGNIGGASSASLITGADGTASVTVSTVASDTGNGSVVANITSSPANQCGQTAAPAGVCTATATYTVATAVTPTSLALQAVGPHTIGKQELIAATVTNSDGTPAANQVVRFQITGANTASGSGQTNLKGVAFFAYTPTHAGTDHISAYADVANNGVADSGDPSSTHNLSIGSGAKEHPTIRLTTHDGKVIVHVTSRPSLSHAVVTYYVERLGRFHEIGSNRTGSGGHAHKAFKKKVGVQFTFRAKVSGKHGVKTGTSKAKSIRVKG